MVLGLTWSQRTSPSVDVALDAMVGAVVVVAVALGLALEGPALSIAKAVRATATAAVARDVKRR